MKRFVIVQCAIILTALIIGMCNRLSFKDAGIMDVRNVQDLDRLDCNISEMLTDDMYDEWSSDDFQNERIELCKNAENVIIVEPLDELRCYGMNMLQKVQVKECIKGNIEKDSIIWINKSGGPSRESVPHEYDNDALVYILNFSDVMRTDMEYIAMLNSEQTIAEYLDIPIYNGTDSIFTYFAINNTNIPVEKDIEDIKLSELKNCDIFAQSQKTLDCIEQIKHEVLTEYGIRPIY